jgi:hypothetical protein
VREPTDSDATELPGQDEQPVARLAPTNRAGTVAGLAVVTLLFAVCVGLVLQGGAYDPSTWLPLMAAVAALAIPLATVGPVATSGRFQRMVLAVFALQAVWTAASVFWAGSQSNAWQETNRTLFYALTLALAFTAVRWAGSAALKALAAAVVVVAGVVAALVLVTLAVSADPLSLFMERRLNYPITYFNGLAALLMMGFWLALGMANGVRSRPKTAAPPAPDPAEPTQGDRPATVPATEQSPQSRVAWRRSQARKGGVGRFPLWIQPLLLALAVVLVEVALLPQSRGALWTFSLVLPFFVILSSHRFRALIDLVIVVMPVVLFWDRLNAPYLALSNQTSLDAALSTNLTAIGYSVAVVMGAWVVTWLIERWVGPLRRKAAVWISVALAALTIFGAAGGIVAADIRTGGLDGYVADRWHELTADAVGATEGATRFTGVGLNGRLRTWKVTAEAFSDSPILGLGAQNFEAYWYEHRPAAFTIRQPHSQPLQLLSELGAPGALLWLAFVIAALVYATIARFRSPDQTTRVVLAATMTAVISWFIHSSADWLWQLAGVTLPAMMLFGALLGATGKGAAKPVAPGVAGDVDVTAEAGAPRSRRRASAAPARRSPLARGLVLLVAVVAIASAALPYVSQRYSGLASGAADLEQMNSRARTAAALDPTSIEPFAAGGGAPPPRGPPPPQPYSSSLRALSTTLSAVIPNSRYSTLAGADAPK